MMDVESEEEQMVGPVTPVKPSTPARQGSPVKSREASPERQKVTDKV